MKNSKICPKCQRRYPCDTEVCPEDGHRLESAAPWIECPTCGRMNPPGNRFCEEDGTKLMSEPRESEIDIQEAEAGYEEPEAPDERPPHCGSD